MKTNMPSCATSPCWAKSANCIAGRGALSDMRAILGDGAAILGVVGVRAGGDERRAREIVLWRRRARAPFQSGGAPGIGAGALAAEQRPAQIKEWQHIGDGEDRGAGRGQHVP